MCHLGGSGFESLRGGGGGGGGGGQNILRNPDRSCIYEDSYPISAGTLLVQADDRSNSFGSKYHHS